MTIRLDTEKQFVKMQHMLESLREELPPEETLLLLKEVVFDLKQVLDQITQSTLVQK